MTNTSSYFFFHVFDAVVFVHQEGSKDDKSEKEKKVPPPPVPLSRLFHFADTLDVILMVVGSITACAVGATMYVLSIHRHRHDHDDE